MIKKLPWKINSLRVRLTAWYIFLLALTLTLFSSYLYIQLEKSLLAQLDTNLQLTSTQTVTNLINSNGHLAFRKTVDSQAMTQHLLEAGFAIRLIDEKGQILDGLGRYEAIPITLPIQTSFSNLKTSTTTWRVYSQILPDTNNKGEWLQVAESLEPIYEASEHLLTLMVLGFPLVLVIAEFGGLFLADRALRPIERIIRTAGSIGVNDFTQRIGYQGSTDEVRRLAKTLDRMLDRLQLGFEHERRFTADAAHELRTPLTVIKGRIGVTLSRPRTVEEYEQTLQNLEQETDRLIRLTHGLLFLARLDLRSMHPTLLQPVDLSNLLSTLVEQMQPLASTQHIQIIAQISPQLFIRGNADYLTNLFLNLIDNALKYTPSGGTVTVKATQKYQVVEVQVQDTGAGIEAKHLPFLFDRFYRVEEARTRRTGGAGLGLAIANEITRLHNGKLTVESQVNQGTTFSFTVTSHQSPVTSVFS
ncbi:ATP-binding protein [Capilliphycus salinus ALCB114379]|uniref:sensor histidine kinase n=1 Tax=Capilliphycus salinus TaxID=2768948 RepID=UPI0039A5B9A7